MTEDAASRTIRTVGASWRPLREAAGRLAPEALELRTTAGWSAKEMLAHVAFWDEAAFAVIVGMFRHEPLPPGWTFGSGYLPAEGEGWPPADEHNAREAGWARGRSAAEVLTRLDHAHDQLVAILATVTDEEAAEHRDYFDRLGSHYDEHQPELDALVPTA